MRFKMQQKDTRRLLWRDSPCTLRCVIQNPSMDNAKRFHYGSIYFKDDVHKPKKVFTQFEKPELLLLNFRRQLEQVDIRARKINPTGKTHSPTPHKDKFIKRQLTSPLQVRLYQRPNKIEFRHDRHGNRSTYYGEYDVKQMSERLKQTRKNFYSSHRMDLSRPSNFYPGPGSYFKGKDKPMRHTFSGSIRAFSSKSKTQ